MAKNGERRCAQKSITAKTSAMAGANFIEFGGNLIRLAGQSGRPPEMWIHKRSKLPAASKNRNSVSNLAKIPSWHLKGFPLLTWRTSIYVNC